jgi:hypothetical protein
MLTVAAFPWIVTPCAAVACVSSVQGVDASELRKGGEEVR